MQWLPLFYEDLQLVYTQTTEVIDLYEQVYCQLKEEKKKELQIEVENKQAAVINNSLKLEGMDDVSEDEKEALEWASKNKLKVVTVLHTAIKERVAEITEQLDKNEELPKRSFYEKLKSYLEKAISTYPFAKIEKLEKLLKALQEVRDPDVRETLISPKRKKDVKFVDSNNENKNAKKRGILKKSQDEVPSTLDRKEPMQHPHEDKQQSIKDIVEQQSSKIEEQFENPSTQAQSESTISSLNSSLHEVLHRVQEDVTEKQIQMDMETLMRNLESMNSNSTTDKRPKSASSMRGTRPMSALSTASTTKLSNTIPRSDVSRSLVRSAELKIGLKKVKPLYSWEQHAPKESTFQVSSKQLEEIKADAHNSSAEDVEFEIHMTAEEFFHFHRKRDEYLNSLQKQNPMTPNIRPLSHHKSPTKPSNHISPLSFLKKGQGKQCTTKPSTNKNEQKEHNLVVVYQKKDANRSLEKARDRMMKKMALKNLRTQYDLQRNLSNPQEITAMVEQANQAASFAKMSVVQGVKGNEGYTIQMGKENVDPFLDGEVMVSSIDERLIQREERKQKKEENKKN